MSEMRTLLAALLISTSALAGAQSILDIRNDFHFSTDAVARVAEPAYRARIQALAETGRLDVDAALLARVRGVIAVLKIGARFEHAQSAAIDWEIHTCQRCAETASAMAGGRLLVGEQFVRDLELSDDELGFVLAHEMAHVLAEHSREYVSVARYFVDHGRYRDFEDIQNELNESFVVNLRMATVSEQQEIDADYIGFILGARSGYDPAAMLSLLAKLGGESKAIGTVHPAKEKRIHQAHVMLEAARRIRASHGYAQH
jgi:predicted Zn-dependent protease